MATLEELVVKLEADNAKLITALEESAKVTARSSKQMEDSISKFSEEASKKTSKFDDVMTVFAGTTLANVAVGAFNLAADAASAFMGMLGDGIGEAAGFEKEMVKLANSLALSGNFSDKAAQDLQNYVGAMEDLSGIDDQVIAGNLAMLSSMTKLDAEGLQKAQSAALDLSAAMGIDLATATKMVGKAASGETDSFKKLGISIQETGDKSQTFANTLSTLESRFGGAAGGAMKTFSGAMLSAQNAVGNLFQALGDVVTSNPAVIAVLGELTKIINEMKSSVEGNADSLKKGFAEALTTTLMVMEAVAGGVEEFVRIMVAGFKTIYLGVQATVDSFQAMKAVMSGDFAGAADAFKETGEVFESLAETTNSTGGVVSSTLGKIASASQTATATMDSSLKAVQPTIENVKNKVVELTFAEQQRANAAKEFANTLLESSVSVQSAYQMQQDALQTSYNSDIINFETYKAAKLQSQLDYFAQEQAMLDQARANNSITEQQYAMAQSQLMQQQAVQRFKAVTDMNKQEEVLSKQRTENLKSTFGTIATLQQSSSKELQAIGKAAALAQATMDGYAAVQKALSSAPPPFNFALAAVVGAATAANLAKISSVGLKSGIDSVPGVGSGDSFPAMLAPGERVVPSETNKDLTDFLSKQTQGESSPIFNLNFYGPVWSDKASAGAEIVDAINEAIARGMSVKLGAV